MELTGRDTLDTTTTSETSDSGLGDTLNVVTKNLSVALGTALAETLSALATARHCVVLKCLKSWCEVRFDCARNGGGLCVLLKAECKWGSDNDQVSSYIPRLSVYLTR